MKKLLLAALILCAALTIQAQTVSTVVRGNSFATNSFVVTATNAYTPGVKLYLLTGYTATTQYIQVFQTNAVPANGTTPLFSLPISAGQGYSFDFSYYGADLDKLTICNSTTANTLTLGAADTTFQAILRR